MNNQDLTQLSINTIRTLSMDGVQKANSGHPGAPMALAPVAYTLYRHVMKHTGDHPDWINRDRFILSNGHASMLLYSILYLSGYEVSLDDLKNFRQWGSPTPGHPEYRHCPGVETTTGPLGQGFMNGVGMAMAEAFLAALINEPGYPVIDHFTYGICSDGDLMEGASHEAASLAGHLGLGKLIFLYDDNKITIEGNTSITFTENVEQRFLAYGWQVINLGDAANDTKKLEAAFMAAQDERKKPSLIILRTHIGFGSPKYQDTSEAHGSPLGEQEVQNTKKVYNWLADETFYVPDAVRNYMLEQREVGNLRFRKWQEMYSEFKEKFPEKAAQLDAAMDQRYPLGWENQLPVYVTSDGPVATRAVNAKVLQALSSSIPWLIGGSADLEPSTKTAIKGSPLFSKENYAGRNIAWGVREMAMCAASSGMALHGGVRPYAATFFVFTDYARPAIRLASLMELPVIYVMTHDSIGLGEDGPTHQPVEHLASLRAMPNLTVIRPADANETVCAWKIAIQRKNGPTMLVLSRQNLAILDPSQYPGADLIDRGAYVLMKEKKSRPDLILIATGSEVHIALEAQAQLWTEGIDTRVVSMPSWELFEEQDEEYQSNVLPPDVKLRISIEAGSTMGWHRWVGDQGKTIGLDHFGASAPFQRLYQEFGITASRTVQIAKNLLGN